MGVPSFYRWLINKYPNVVVKATEDKGECINTSFPNPNGIEFDNFYLDMNEIIYSCLSSDDNDSFNNIFEYVDNLFSIVRPRKLLYLAIDGVAPLAKMNQQRSARFRIARSRKIRKAEIKRLIEQFQMEGKPVLLEYLLPNHKSEVSNSYVVSPGTEFVYKLSKALRSYVISRINNDPGWKDIKVILSDANVPGEGEHKIMSFIRQQRNASTGYDPNTRHCVRGHDADLIMLALATHEVHFSILREEPQPIHESSEEQRSWFKKPYEFLHIWILREYLELDMKISEHPDNLKIDLERIVDDFIFLCLFMGNDFLPRMPSFEVHEGDIDFLMTVYKKEFNNLGGYLLDMSKLVEDKTKGYINLSRVEKFILLVGSYEEKIFKKRSEFRKRILRNLSNYSNKQDEYEGADMEIGTSNNSHALPSEKDPTFIDSAENITLSYGYESADSSNESADSSEIVKNTEELIDKLNYNLEKNSDLFKNGHLGLDKVRLGTVGWKERYYKEKFSAETWRDIENLRKEIVKKYTEGLLWVLLYYFSGVPSWSWFYPYHYSPFASDLKGLAEVSVEFQKGSPLKPFDQLLASLPPESAPVLPKAYQALMTDAESKIIDFYPTDFDIDLEGKRFMWQGICKLPFIKEECLLSETKELEKGLLIDEALRNKNNVDQLYVSSTHKLASQILSLSPNENKVVEIDSNMRCVSFETRDDVVHISRLLDGVIFPIKSITEGDVMETKFQREYEVNKPSNRYERFRKADSSLNSASSWSPRMIHEGYNKRFTTDSSSEVIYKGVGVGWGAGRGKVNDTSTINKHIESRERVILPSSSFAEQKSSMSSWYARNSYSSIVTSSCDLNEQVSPHGGAQSMNNNIWQSKNVQQQRIKFGASPSHQGRGQHSSDTSFVQGRGRGRDVQHSSVDDSGTH